ncbi:NADPH cytochrome P450 oxidoreductase family protein [Bacterioplanoides pacificum]|uniref:NADPH--hemoprotein reductase n=1 Tax=Bacterioplanoides pacificum TaxID=1171596 RepID=A0ABV7VQP3_9GAMM
MLALQPYLSAGLLVLGYLLFCLWCYRRVLSQTRLFKPAADDNPVILVAYASEGGRAQQLAQHTARRLSGPAQGQVECLALNQLSLGRLQQLQQLIVVASTYGDGEAPDNGRLFLPRLAAATLPGLKFAVLALGDSDYPQFCAFGKQLQQQLMRCGAQPLFDLVCLDQQQPEQQPLQHWWQGLAQAGLYADTSDEVAATLSDAARPQLHARLSQRRLLNPDTDADGLYELQFQPEDKQPGAWPLWQAGDIAELTLPARPGQPAQTRQYTIASVPEEGVLRLLVRLQHQTDGTPGLGSGWLCQQLNIGEQAVFTRLDNPGFHAPDDNTPLILIGNGSGLAGLRAHLAQRPASSQNWLLFGERSPYQDAIWQDTLKDWLNDGRLQHLDLAFSRWHGEDGEALSTQLSGQLHSGYVQQALQAQQARLQHWLQQGACIYVCGSRVGMAQDLDEMLTTLLGEPMVEQLIQTQRYRRDVY